MSIKGTKTEANLIAALNGESVARNKYTYFAECARKEGLVETAELFERMSKNETAHAKLWYKLLHGLGETSVNLESAFAGENYEWKSMYPQFAEEARAEGFPNIGKMFDKIAAIEKHHELEFLAEYARVLSGGQAPEPKKNTRQKPAYRCQFCGHIHTEDDEMPAVCPVCGAIGAFEYTTVTVAGDED